jgi:endonuclease/exonuclease/phosphatase family metal-dependent hydrolase
VVVLRGEGRGICEQHAHGAYTSPTLAAVIRSWNVFHGRSHPPDRRLSVEEAVRLVSSDEPTIVCLQELPVWSLPKLEAWSGMTAIPAITVRPSVGPVPIPAALGRRLVELDPRRLRAAFCGQANAVLVTRRARVLESRSVVLNDAGFRRAQGRRLQLDLVTRLAWAKERRACQCVRVVIPDDRVALVANLHLTSMGSDERLADAELLRAASFVDALADPGDLVVLAGDLNVEPGGSATLGALAREEWGFSPPGPGIDHVLVRGADVSEHHGWPLDRRRVEGRLLSDHAPVEVALP